MPPTIALIAHDTRKAQLTALVQRYAPTLGRYRVIATGTTGERIQSATQLNVELLQPGPMGGDAQIAAEVVSGDVAAVIFYVDPLTTQPHEPEVHTLLRICTIHNVPIATNEATAEAILERFVRSRMAYLIYNPVAGQGSVQDLNFIVQTLQPHFHLVVHETQADQPIVELVNEAIAQGADLVIASGGDGTVSEVAGALIGTHIPLGVIPRGTANAFAASLGLPRVLPIRNACQVILQGYTRKVDAAFCNGLPMVLLAGIGFEAQTIELASREMKDQWGVLAYIMAGFQAMDQGTLFDTEIEVDGQIYTLQANAITIANAAPATSVLAQGAGEVIPDDGLLDVTIASAETKLEGITTMLRMFGAAIARLQASPNNVVHYRVKRLRVVTNPPQKVVVDGEIIGTTPLDVETVPAGLTVFVPNNQG
jgi:diacylglycerol kinase (ATP)